MKGNQDQLYKNITKYQNYFNINTSVILRVKMPIIDMSLYI